MRSRSMPWAVAHLVPEFGIVLRSPSGRSAAELELLGSPVPTHALLGDCAAVSKPGLTAGRPWSRRPTGLPATTSGGPPGRARARRCPRRRLHGKAGGENQRRLISRIAKSCSSVGTLCRLDRHKGERRSTVFGARAAFPERGGYARRSQHPRVEAGEQEAPPLVRSTPDLCESSRK